MSGVDETDKKPDQVNILLVDDQPSRLLSYEAILGDLGENLVRAGSGDEALQRLMKTEFAVILLDVSMPGMDGFETATLIHQHPRFERTPIIFVTAHHVTDLDRMKGYGLGAVDYVFVPVVPEILRSKVMVFTQLHRQRRELQRLNESLERANTELAAANSTLQAEKTRELERLNRTLEAANADLGRANRTLHGEIAERERLEEALREVDRRKDEFLAMLAHELRNPLAPILNVVQLMRLKQIQDAEMLWCRDVIERQAEHLTRLVDDLLDVSRITQGKIKLQKQTIEIADIVSRAVEAGRPLMDARRHALTVEVPSEPLYVEGDPTRLSQVLGNLLNNAAKYTEDGGRIRLTVERCANPDGRSDVVLRVRDSGVGIPAEMLPKVFDLFTQVERTLDRAQGGLGIGLALVRRLVEMHGGTVTAASEGENQGSEFVVRLPLAARAADAAEAPAPVSTSSAPRAGRRVLVVDDNRDSARTMTLLLRKMGNEVATAYDGAEAVEAAASFSPDVVLLDIGLPVLNGYDAARAIRARANGKSMTLVALTGWGQEDDRRRSREAGIDLHIVKPVDRRILQQLLDRIGSAENTAPAAARD
jgi:signal transduction histidine kinase